MKPNDSRNTPEEVAQPVRAFFGGQVPVDPCSNAWSIIGAAVEYTIDDDGLAQNWAPGAYVNPPWSNILPWAQKAVDELLWSGAEVLLWLPCYPETAYSRLLYAYSERVCFWGRRVGHPLEGKPAQGSMWPTQLIYLGERLDDFDATFREFGTPMQPLHS